MGSRARPNQRINFEAKLVDGSRGCNIEALKNREYIDSASYINRKEATGTPGVGIGVRY